METTTIEQNAAENSAYEYAANLLLHGKKTSEEVVESLTQQGLNRESATVL